MFRMPAQQFTPRSKSVAFVQQPLHWSGKFVEARPAANRSTAARESTRWTRIRGWIAALRSRISLRSRSPDSPQPAKPLLKPSQAMRAGAKLRPQAYGAIYARGRSCAIGAMLEGMGYDPARGEKRMNAYLEASGLSQALLAQIATMNDSRHPRECIAYWLEQIGR